MRLTAWLGGAAWAGSWYLMYLEITRWHHVKPSLAFNADIGRAAGVEAHPGGPLLLLYGVCAAAPAVTVSAAVIGARARRSRR
jgi:hypothetical protein